jgi:hypothetical protein
MKLGHRPYDMEKTFVCRTFFYHVKWKTNEQGKVSEHWTIKKRCKYDCEKINIVKWHAYLQYNTSTA